jgi:hypothetical protein
MIRTRILTAYAMRYRHLATLAAKASEIRQQEPK